MKQHLIKFFTGQNSNLRMIYQNAVSVLLLDPYRSLSVCELNIVVSGVRLHSISFPELI